MARPTSLFHRNFQALMWVAFSLLAILPLLAVFRVWLLLHDDALSAPILVEICSLLVFAGASLTCGFFVLRSFGSTLRQLSQTEAALNRLAPPALPSGAKPDEIRIQNELISLTQSLSRIHTEFSKNMEEAHRQAKFLDNLQHVLNHSSDMILILDGDGGNRITFSNRSAREKLGLLPDHSMRHALAEGLLTAEDGARLAAILEAWNPVDETLVCSRLNGGSMYIHCVLTVVDDAASGGRSKIVVLRDLTDRKRMERQLYRTEQLASLGQLISGVAHELNNPLSAVLGFSELCRDPRLTKADLDHNLTIIEREAARTAHIVENPLNFSRQRTSRRAPADIHDLLDRCFSLLAYNFRTSGVGVQLRYAKALPVLEVDEYQLQQVFMNLIINAAQAMREAGVPSPRITAATSLSGNGREIRIEITDNGPGIPGHLVPRIFDPFFTTKGDDQGTGLGLTVSRDIILAHGGEISVRSETGKGCSFFISLPVHQPVLLREDGPGRREVTRPIPEDSCGNALVVDDEQAVLEMALAALRGKGWNAVGAGGIPEAREKIRREQPDLIICDACMPDGDGVAFWEELKRAQPDLARRFLFITGDPLTARRLQGLSGSPQVLLKPFHVDELCRSVALLAPVPAAR